MLKKIYVITYGAENNHSYILVKAKNKNDAIKKFLNHTNGTGTIRDIKEATIIE